MDTLPDSVLGQILWRVYLDDSEFAVEEMTHDNVDAILLAMTRIHLVCKRWLAIMECESGTFVALARVASESDRFAYVAHYRFDDAWAQSLLSVFAPNGTIVAGRWHILRWMRLDDNRRGILSAITRAIMNVPDKDFPRLWTAVVDTWTRHTKEHPRRLEWPFTIPRSRAGCECIMRLLPLFARTVNDKYLAIAFVGAWRFGVLDKMVSAWKAASNRREIRWEYVIALQGSSRDPDVTWAVRPLVNWIFDNYVCDYMQIWTLVCRIARMSRFDQRAWEDVCWCCKLRNVDYNKRGLQFPFYEDE
jgi:hypothetical protein